MAIRQYKAIEERFGGLWRRKRQKKNIKTVAASELDAQKVRWQLEDNSDDDIQDMIITLSALVDGDMSHWMLIQSSNWRPFDKLCEIGLIEQGGPLPDYTNERVYRSLITDASLFLTAELERRAEAAARPLQIAPRRRLSSLTKNCEKAPKLP